jgi:hypothetical protein
VNRSRAGSAISRRASGLNIRTVVAHGRNCQKVVCNRRKSVAELRRARGRCARCKPMPLHLLKLCVGVDSVQDLEDWIKRRMKEKRKKGEKPEHIHTTRMVPKRADELVDGGSLYWVIRGVILCRERLLAVRPFVDKDGIGRCRLVMDGKLHLVQPRPFRAFQGWRYLSPKDAPEDLDRAAPGARNMPEQMRRELRELGLL